MGISIEEIRNWFRVNRRTSLDKPSIVAFLITLFWFAGNVISPFLAPAGTINFGDEGVVGSGDLETEIAEIENGFARFFYNAGDANCHQRASRSFFLNGNQMPFCSRCTAIFLGLAVGVAILIFLNLELNILWIILGLVPMAIDGGVQLLNIGYESTNPVRFVTGLLAGIVTGIALGYIVSEMSRMVTNNNKR
jgi:uncharacterized membrane protein